MATLLQVLCVLLLTAAVHVNGHDIQNWRSAHDSDSLDDTQTPLQTYNDYGVPYFLQNLIPTLNKRSESNEEAIPISTRISYRPDFGYQTRYAIAEEVARKFLLRYKLLHPGGAGRRRRDTNSE